MIGMMGEMMKTNKNDDKQKGLLRNTCPSLFHQVLVRSLEFL